MLLFVLAVVCVLFIGLVAIHHSRVERIQSDCMGSIEELRSHHEQLMRQSTARHSQKQQEMETRYRVALDASNEMIHEVQNKLKVAEVEKFKERKKHNEAIEKFDIEFDTLRKQNSELSQEVAALSDIVGNVRKAIEAV
jgi:uncharacterized protein YfkK (UPF0435 family)